ncbi:JAB-like toxin 1 domain-containing protein, partial [uncultured Muribaculum sp.]|uniref:JAB-like toxin 1 domain-containing protein n=1 Tax=uncultured Muribaculum sp. TaxID=1918613 RepID=UPI0026DFB925
VEGRSGVSRPSSRDRSRPYRCANGHRQTIIYDGVGRKLRVDYCQVPEAFLMAPEAIHPDGDYEVKMRKEYIGPHIVTDGRLSYTSFDGGYFDPEAGTMYYITDWQGNNAAVVSAGGDIVQQTTYYPYGEPTVEPAGQPFLFGGKEREHGGGRNIHDFGARCLTPYGNWSVTDPLYEKFFPISQYSYCGGDPINRVDPDGTSVYEFNSQGALVNYEFNTGYDLIRINTENGRVQEVVFEYGTIQRVRHVTFKDSPNAYYIKIRGVENSEAIFTMLACNTNVEWSLVQAENKITGETVNYIGTTQVYNEEKCGKYIATKVISNATNELSRYIHSHPDNSLPSGLPDQSNPEG